jgi:hypothetical protein
VARAVLICRAGVVRSGEVEMPERHSTSRRSARGAAPKGSDPMAKTARVKFDLKGEGPVSLTSFVGSAQFGHVVVFLGTVKLAEGFGTVQIGLGGAAGLVGKTMTITSTVLDIRPETDSTGLISVIQGAGSQDTLHTEEVVEAGGRATFLHVVDFTKAN